jgi:hypothetical protein
MPSQSKNESSVGANILPNSTEIQKPPSAKLHDHRKVTDISSTNGIEDDSEDILAATLYAEVDLENGEGKDLKRKQSNVIPRNKRRGLLAQFVIGIPEIDDPVQYSQKTKIFIVFIISTAALAGPMG